MFRRGGDGIKIRLYTISLERKEKLEDELLWYVEMCDFHLEKWQKKIHNYGKGMKNPITKIEELQDKNSNYTIIIIQTKK